jgi:hypothetical protein
LPNLPQNLTVLYCLQNKLTSLPNLPQNLKTLNCSNNKITSLPNLPQNLHYLTFYDNPIYYFINNELILYTQNLTKIKENIRILNKFRDLYYCLRLKKQLRKWLWEKVREPKIKEKYSPKYLIENLKEEDDLDTFLSNWN